MKKYKYRMSDFEITECEMDSVSFENIKRVMDKKTYNEFLKWIANQTVWEKGVYVDDLRRFLAGMSDFRY